MRILSRSKTAVEGDSTGSQKRSPKEFRMGSSKGTKENKKRISPFKARLSTASEVVNASFDYLPYCQLVYGCTLLLLGGNFCYTLLAYEAIHLTGTQYFTKAYQELKSSYLEAYELVRVDTCAQDLVDEEISHLLLLQIVCRYVWRVLAREEPNSDELELLKLLLHKCNPNKLLEVFSAMYMGMTAAVACLRFQLAQNVVTGSALGTALYLMYSSGEISTQSMEELSHIVAKDRIIPLTPNLTSPAAAHPSVSPYVRPASYAPMTTRVDADWADFFLKSGFNLCGIVFATCFMRFTFAINSANSGAKLILESLGQFDIQVPEKHKTNILMSVAALGVGLQLTRNFVIPPILWVPLFPLIIVENVCYVVANTTVMTR